MTPPREVHVEDLRAGRAALVGTKLVLRAPIPERPSATATPSPRTSSAPTAPSSGRHAPATQRRRDANGKVGEEVAEILHDICRRDGVAEVMKVPTAMQPRGPDPCDPRYFRAVFAAKVGCDYRGWMLDGSGRAVVAEVKHLERDDDSYSLAKLRPDQREQLESAARDAHLAECAAAIRAAVPCPTTTELLEACRAGASDA